MSGTPTLEDIAAVMDAATENALLELVRNIARGLGFDHFMLGVEVNRPLLKPVQHVSSGYPLRWQRIYVERDFVWKDPTVTHCQQHANPLIWSEQMYSEHNRELWEEARAHGISHGMSVPVHDRPGTKSMFSLARDQPLERGSKEVDRVLAGARVLASCTHVAMTKIIVPDLLRASDPKLTPREKECLLWTAKGKTAAEIGMILNISEATAVFHLNNVVRKFNVANKTQAIAVGVAMGLVQ